MSEIKVELDDYMGDDLKPCRMAKDSFGRTTDWVDGELSDKDERLLHMLARGMGQREYEDLTANLMTYALEGDEDALMSLVWKFRHTTPHLAPFGHNFVTFKFQAPVFVMRQVVKHEYLRISELSMRYVRDMPEYYRPKSWRSVAEDVKQGSGKEVCGKLDRLMHGFIDDAEYRDSFLYKDAIEDGVCPEQARMFLRLCHMTQGHFSGSMDAIAGLVIKRLDSHAQEETKDFAKQVDKIMFSIYPKSWAALTEGVCRD